MIIFHPRGAPLPSVHIMNREALACDGYSITINMRTTRGMEPPVAVSLESSLEDKTFLMIYRHATRGSKSVENIGPFKDERLPFYRFAHSGTLGYMFPSLRLSDSEQYFREVFIDKHVTDNNLNVASLAERRDMREVGSKYILYSVTQPVYIYGIWYNLNGVLYSSLVEGGIPVGKEDSWSCLGQ